VELEELLEIIETARYFNTS